jgi:hypothetical protein
MEFWVKAVGAARAPLRDEWLREEITVDGGLAASPRLAERVHFPHNKRPVGISIGDYFLLYGVTERGGKIIGAGIFKSHFRKDDGSTEPGLRSAEDIAAWPWRIDIEILISVWHAHHGPMIDAIGIEPVKMRRRSHLRLTEGQYLSGINALAQAARPPN